MKVHEILTENEVLDEARTAPLYHATSFKNAIGILSQNKINGVTNQTITNQLKKKYAAFKNSTPNSFRGVSFTRDYNFAKAWAKDFGDEDLSGVTFVFDQEKMSRTFGKRLIPLNFYAYSNEYPEEERQKLRGQGTSENEEFLLGDLSNMNSFVTKIILYTTLRSNEEILNYGIPIQNANVLLNNPKLVKDSK